MITVKIGEKKFRIATTWEETNFQIYSDLRKLEKEELTTYEKEVKVVALCSDNFHECYESLLDLSDAKFEQINSKMSFKDITTIENTKPDFIMIDDKKFRFKSNHNEITMKELSRIEEISKQFKDEVIIEEVALAVLLREIVTDVYGNEVEKPVDAKSINFVLERLRQVKTTDVYHYITFFLSGEKNSTKTTLDFSIEEN